MKKQVAEQSSVTFQMPVQRKTMMENLAYRVGLRRVSEEVEKGNLSAILNLMAEFVVEHAEQFGEWLKARAVSAMEKEKENK